MDAISEISGNRKRSESIEALAAQMGALYQTSALQGPGNVGAASAGQEEPQSVQGIGSQDTFTPSVPDDSGIYKPQDLQRGSQG
jgi:hypothetical protein